MKMFFKVIDRMNELIGKAVSFLILVLIGVIVYEIFVRYLLNSPTIWAHEVSQMVYGAYVILLGGYLQQRNGHVNVDILYQRFKPRTRAIINLFTWLLFFAFCGVILSKGRGDGLGFFPVPGDRFDRFCPAHLSAENVDPAGRFTSPAAGPGQIYRGYQSGHYRQGGCAMSIELITVLLFGALILFLALGLPLAFVLGGVGVVGSYLLWGDRGLYLIATQAYASMGKFTLLAIPLFIFMSMILERAGVADDLYTLMHRWMGPVPGGLAIGTVIICTIFAAMAGISGAATVSMGIIALPAMLSRGYDKTIAMGCISGGGALGILIPPSVPMILYATLTGVSIGGLFAGGILPGLLLAALFILYIGVRCHFQPNLGPPLPVEERVSWREKFISLRAVLLPIMIIIMVLGSIYVGVCTATEASALGCVGAIISAAVYRKLNWTSDQRVLFPDRRPYGPDHLDPHRGVRFHGCLHRYRGACPDGTYHDVHSRRAVGHPDHHADNLFHPGMHPGPCGHHHDLHPRLCSGNHGPGI